MLFSNNPYQMKLPITQHKQQFQMYYYQEDGEATANCYASQVPFSAILSSVYIHQPGSSTPGRWLKNPSLRLFLQPHKTTLMSQGISPHYPFQGSLICFPCKGKYIWRFYQAVGPTNILHFITCSVPDPN